MLGKLLRLPNRIGISHEDYNEGVALLGQWSKDPVGVAREVVSRTLAMGHNVTDILGNSAGDALEMGAVRQLINEATRGQRQQEEVSTAQVIQQTQARQQYDQFVMRYPDAETHGDAIANLMNTQQLSAVEAYHEVKHFALRNGLDFNSATCSTTTGCTCTTAAEWEWTTINLKPREHLWLMVPLVVAQQ